VVHAACKATQLPCFLFTIHARNAPNSKQQQLLAEVLMHLCDVCGWEEKDGGVRHLVAFYASLPPWPRHRLSGRPEAQKSARAYQRHRKHAGDLLPARLAMPAGPSGAAGSEDHLCMPSIDDMLAELPADPNMAQLLQQFVRVEGGSGAGGLGGAGGGGGGSLSSPPKPSLLASPLAKAPAGPLAQSAGVVARPSSRQRRQQLQQVEPQQPQQAQEPQQAHPAEQQPGSRSEAGAEGRRQGPSPAAAEGGPARQLDAQQGDLHDIEAPAALGGLQQQLEQGHTARRVDREPLDIGPPLQPAAPACQQPAELQQQQQAAALRPPSQVASELASSSHPQAERLPAVTSAVAPASTTSVQHPAEHAGQLTSDPAQQEPAAAAAGGGPGPGPCCGQGPGSAREPLQPLEAGALAGRDAGAAQRQQRQEQEQQARLDLESKVQAAQEAVDLEAVEDVDALLDDLGL
jgi:hypothetical protein